MKRYFLAFFLGVLLLFTGCASATRNFASPESSSGAPSSGIAIPQKDSNGGFEAEKPASEVTTSGSSAAIDQRIVIRNANLSIVVADPSKSMEAISRMAETMGGYVVTSDLHKAYTRNGVEIPEASLVVRVPAEQLNSAITQIKQQVDNLETDILSENITGQDVTKEYTDLNSQLKNLEDAEAQLREIMASATKTEDVLAIFQQLTQIRRDIEVLKGQIQYYEESAALSSISIQIQAQEAIQPLEVGGWKPQGIARDAVQALIDTLQFLASAAIWIVILIIPVSLLIFGPLVLLVWLIRRMLRKRKKQPPMVTPPTIPPAEN